MIDCLFVVPSARERVTAQTLVFWLLIVAPVLSKTTLGVEE
jgi:hypothetical protein